MSKVKIKIVFLGHLPHSVDQEKITNWKSELYEIVKPINTFNLTNNSDGDSWEFLDENIQQQLPPRDGSDVLLAVTNVPLENDWFVRRFSDNRVCMTYSTMTEILKFDNIPLENLLLRVLYSVAFVYRRYGNRIPPMEEFTNFTHDETRACIFDMNGIKTDVVYSLNKPQLCHSCVETLTSNHGHKIEKDLVEKVQKELNKIEKTLYFRITDWVKRRPILAIVISSTVAIILGAIGSLLASAIWERLK
jgi:hypothetical protein